MHEFLNQLIMIVYNIDLYVELAPLIKKLDNLLTLQCCLEITSWGLMTATRWNEFPVLKYIDNVCVKFNNALLQLVL